jgi:hypothetical protein
MARRLIGEPAPFRTVADRRKLVGHAIQYLRRVDIDTSGRGFFFPRSGIVRDVSGKNMFLDNGCVLYSSDLVELVDLGASE